MVEYGYYEISEHEFIVFETYNRSVSYEITRFNKEQDAQTFVTGLSSMTV